MARSRRIRKPLFTKVTKKGLAFKQRLVQDIRDSVNRYRRIFVFEIENMRAGPLKDVRSYWKESRIFFGKCKLMALALGKTKESELKENLHLLTKYVKGQRGLFFTNEKTKDIITWFSNYMEPEFARGGSKVTKTVLLPEGNLMDFVSSMEPFLRKLGLPTCIRQGKVHLRHDYVVCQEGEVVTPEQAHILKILGERLSYFKVILKCVWDKNGKFKVLDEEDEEEDDDEDEDGKDQEDNEGGKKKEAGDDDLMAVDDDDDESDLDEDDDDDNEVTI